MTEDLFLLGLAAIVAIGGWIIIEAVVAAAHYPTKKRNRFK